MLCCRKLLIEIFPGNCSQPAENGSNTVQEYPCPTCPRPCPGQKHPVVMYHSLSFESCYELSGVVFHVTLLFLNNLLSLLFIQLRVRKNMKIAHIF